MTKPKHDSELGERAFAAVRAEFVAIKDTDLADRALDIEAVGLAVIGVANRIESNGLKARFVSLPAKEFDPTHVERLSTLAWATYYAGQRYNVAKASESEAKIPAALAAKSAEIEARVQKLCEYHLGDDPDVGPVLAALAPGSSYRDRAGDLLGYARILRDHDDVLKHDTKYYVHGDAALAQKLGMEILHAIGSIETTEAKQWGDDALRALTLLQRSYDEVRSAGLFLERHSSDRSTNYPSIFSAGRPRAGRPRKAKPATDPLPSDPTKRE